MSNSIEVEITGREASLILKYGYPFPDEAAIFEKVTGVDGFHRVTVEETWLALIVGDLSISMKELQSQALLEELDAICYTLEAAMGKLG
ncbi:hypothetical protein LG277_11045 [Vreelandella aquamarina]|uniref:hypothetical protein n=1 Tax=Vreelandella aquamarina TaxID=77097 RepID=UPI003850B1B6